MTRAVLAIAACLLAASCVPKPGDPLRGLRQAERARFEQGRAVFARAFTAETGLGPLFNANGCGECHEDPVLGGVGDEVEVHATALLADGLCDPLADRGGPVYQQDVTPALRAALGIDREPIPAEASATGRRNSPDVLGFGLLDAVRDAEILALADPDDRDGDGISGRPNRFFDGRLGRFGRKAFVPALDEFNEGAFTAEMGVTTPGVPDEGTVGGQPLPPGVDPLPEPELSADDLRLLNDFVRFLAAPARRGLDGSARRGEKTFERIGCASCHVPRLRTGPSNVRAIAHRTVSAYTDLLLHDMGPELADICLGLAEPAEFRTEPLMGLRLSESFLHDGRAGTVEEAIQQHAGEARASRDRFAGLSDAERADLLAFLAAL